MLIPGKMAELFGFVFVMVVVGYFMYDARKTGKIYGVRRIAGLDAIDETVQRATEMGKPVIVVPGTGDVSDAFAVQTLAGLAIMRRAAALCAQYDTKLFVSIKKASVFPVAAEGVRESFMKENRPDLFREDTVQWFSEEQFAHAMATIELMHREGCAGAILTGFFQAEAVILAEAAAQGGAVTVGGCGRLSQIPWFLVCCDYCLIGEELLVAGAYLDKRPLMLGAIRGQDIGKIAVLALTLIGVLMVNLFKSDWLIQLLKR